jgi:hypothetical protein
MEGGEETIALENTPAQDKAFYVNLLKTQFTKIGEMGFIVNAHIEWHERTKGALEKLDLLELQAIARGAQLLLLAEDSSAAS